jgi:uncharacterized phage protein gp47/JayE
MITSITPVKELKQIFSEELFNHTDKITKIAPGSVLNGVAFGVAKLGQKALKEVAITEAHILPESAYGPYLDNLAANEGVAPRYGSMGSSTYIRLVAAPETLYLAASVLFNGKEGINFQLEKDCIIPAVGFAYARVFSTTTGTAANVAALTLNRIQNPPTGHQYCINEYIATGGIDLESDEQLRYRVENKINLLGKSTEEMLTQAFIKINPRVLRVQYAGVASNGKNQVLVIAQNGVNFSEAEFAEFMTAGTRLFGLSELRPYNRRGQVYVQFINVDWQPLDVSLRVQLNPQYDADQVRKELQIRLGKYMDYRYFTKNKIDWTDLLQIAKSTPGVVTVPDTTFLPNFDVPIIQGKFPRLRGFKLYDLTGKLLADLSNNLNPVYYPSNVDMAFANTVLF